MLTSWIGRGLRKYQPTALVSMVSEYERCGDTCRVDMLKLRQLALLDLLYNPLNAFAAVLDNIGLDIDYIVGWQCFAIIEILEDPLLCCRLISDQCKDIHSTPESSNDDGYTDITCRRYQYHRSFVFDEEGVRIAYLWRRLPKRSDFPSYCKLQSIRYR
jgi:hypothetical protein